MTIAAQSASQSALSKVATLVNVQSNNDSKWKDNFDSDDIFDEDEKIHLGLRM